VFEENKFDRIIHLGAQAGVRYSLTNPHIYLRSNIEGTLNIFECARKYGIKHIVYASSSSVYGGNTKIPFSESDPVEKPISFYAKTKRSNELMAYTYHHLYGITSTGLRFFTVYGPYSRPDMAAWIFAKNITEGKEIQLFNNGHMRRDFTYVTDIVDGILKAAELDLGCEIINLGNNGPVELTYFVELIEKNLGKKAIKKHLPMQPGDVPATWADISKAKKLLNWEPITSIEEGMIKFIDWYKKYHNIK
jgi:UDP-glucuronate 4-epimerase